MKRIIDEHSKDLRAIEKVYKTAEENVGRQAAQLNPDVLSY